MLTRQYGVAARKTGRYLIRAGMATGLLGFGSLAWAQTAPESDEAGSEPKVTTMQNVVVTARKREALVQDVPVSLSVVTGDALESGRARCRERGCQYG